MTNDTDVSRPTAREQLIGRDLELRVIRSFLRAAAIDGDALLLFGEPGVGKSVLLETAAREAAASGARVLRAAGSEFEVEVSFSALNQVLLPLQTELADVAPLERDALLAALGGSAAPVTDRLVISNAALSLIRRAAEACPVLLVADDIPWIDRASAGVLAFVALRVAGTRVGMIAATRTDTHSFFERGGLSEHEVRPLDESAAAELLSARFPTMAARVRKRVIAEADGNPLALLELPSALSEHQRTARSALPEVLPLGRRLHAVFEARIEPLPRPTRSLLLLAALDGTGDVRVLQADGGERAWLDHLAPAEHARLVHIESNTRRLVFNHPLIRAAVVELATTSERHAAHRTLAEIFASDPERSAWHLAEITFEPDADIARVLEEAARQILRRGDAVGAVAALTRAADLSPSKAERSRLLLEAAYIGAMAGNLGIVSQLLADATQAAPTADESLIAAMAAVSVVLHSDGDIDTGHRLLVEAIDRRIEDNNVGDFLLVAALDNLRVVCQFSARHELWASLDAAVDRLEPSARSAMKLSIEAGDDPARAGPQALDQLDGAIRALANEPDLMTIARVVPLAFYVDRLSDCRSALRRLVTEGKNGSAALPETVGLVLLAFERFWAGDWDEASELAAEGAAGSQAQGFRVLTWPAMYCQALLAAATGDDDALAALSNQLAGSAIPRGAFMVEHYCRHVRSLAALGRADFEDAYRQASGISPAGTLPVRIPVALWVVMDLVEAAVRTGRRAEADAHVAALHETGIASISPRLALAVGASTAIVADDDRASALFADALSTPGVNRWPFEVARVELAFGERLRRARATSESRTHLTRALATFERLGAKPWASRAGNELRATGQTNGRARAVSVSALTPQEQEIAELAAAGLTNKQIAERLFLSPRTVGAHLYRIFPKLGIASRAALRDALEPR